MSHPTAKPHEVRAMQRSMKHLKRSCADLRHLGPQFAEVRDTAEWLRRRVREELRQVGAFVEKAE